jgi:hypothetical protein
MCCHSDGFPLSLLSQIVLKLTGDLFEVEMPNGHEIKFPNRSVLDVITYVRVRGDLKLTAFKIY